MGDAAEQPELTPPEAAQGPTESSPSDAPAAEPTADVQGPGTASPAAAPSQHPSRSHTPEGIGQSPTQQGTDGELAVPSQHGSVPASPTHHLASSRPPSAAPAAAAAAAAPPPYIPPEVGEDYVPVAQLPPLPLAHGTDSDGKPIPLPGVVSLFLTGTTIDLVGLGALGSNKPGAPLMGTVSKEALLKDIQFRGAISDFYAYKAHILEADCEQLSFCINEDDLFGDGNNYQMACAQAAADTWHYIEDESARRQQLLHDEQVRAALEKAKPRNKKTRKAKLWVTLGSEVEIAEARVQNRREPMRMMAARPRREFNQEIKLADKDAHELWNSSQMECRPFKDPNFDLRRLEQDVAVQAVAPLVDLAIQAGPQRLRPNAAQCLPQELPSSLRLEAVQQLARSGFLEKVMSHCEAALIQNEIANIFTDDFAALTDEDGWMTARQESTVTEAQSFTHLAYSKGKVVSAIQWLPHRRGVVAVACTEALSHAERVARAGRPNNAHILVWNFRDPILPECVLQAPSEVFAFQYNPANPDIVAGGCHNGQVLIWDTSFEQDRIARTRSSEGQQQAQEGGDATDDAHIPVICSRYSSAVEFSHHHVVTDLQWLPGMELNHKGRLTRTADSSKDCNFFCTTAGDGKVYFWDIRVDRLMKKGRKVDDLLDLVWRPTHAVHTISLIGMDLGATKLCLQPTDPDRGVFFLGSSDGELAYADFVRQEGEDSPDYVKSITQAHVGPLVSIQKSPFYPEVIVTVGDWSFQLWQEGAQGPFYTSRYAAEYYTCGCWSPSRPAVLYLADQGGNLEIWDMLDRSHEPSIRVALASTPIMSMAFMAAPTGTSAPAGQAAAGGAAAQQVAQAQQAAAQFLAVGDSAGVLRIMELPRNLRRPVPNEKRLMSVFMDREAARVADVAARKSIRDAANKKAQEAAKTVADDADGASRDSAGKDQNPGGVSVKAAAVAAAHKAANAALELDEKAEQEYYRMEHKFKVQLGLIDSDDKDR